MRMLTISEDDVGPKWLMASDHGRKAEVNILNKIAEEKSSACVLLEGSNGSGKTTILRAVNWEEKGWVFVAEKFERHLSTEPYSALKRALDDLVEIWCNNNEKSHEDCKMTELLDLLENDMDLLQNVIPGLFGVLDKFTQRIQLSRKDVANFSTRKNLLSVASQSTSVRDILSDSQRRHEMGDSAAIASAFLRLFSFFSSPKPIILSFDDVQYADASSMEILKFVAQTACTNQSLNSDILLALSYTEMLEQNKFAFEAITGIKTLKSNVHFLHLGHWDVGTINDLVVSLVQVDPEESLPLLPLSEVIHQKTGGNPLAVIQLLRLAREKGHFKFSLETSKWEWGDAGLLDQCFAISDNVATILAASMANQCSSMTNTLAVASCLGHVIPTNVLVEYFAEETGEESKEQSDQTEMRLSKEDLVDILEGAAKNGILVKSKGPAAYTWSNDLLQQAAYESIPAPSRNKLHLKLGRLLWRMGLDREEEWMIFMAANQINLYSQVEFDSSLGNEVAELNVKAACLSLNRGAIYPALDLLLKAEQYLAGDDRWKTSYELTHDILTTLAETKLRVGETETAFKLATEVVQYAKTQDDAFPAHIVMLQCTVSGNDRNYDKGVEKTLFLLNFYGEKHSWKFRLGQETLEKTKIRSRIKQLLPGGELKGLLQQSEMADVALLRIQTLLVNHLAVYASYSTKYNGLSWFASARALKSACKHGISPVTNLALVQLATHLRVDGNYQEASKYAEIALELTDRLPRRLGSDHGQVRMIACGSVFSAVRSFNNCLNELTESRSDFLKAGFARESIGLAIGYTITYLCVGLSLGAAKSNLEVQIADAVHCGCPYAVEQKLKVLEQTVVNLIENVEQPTFLSGAIMDQDDELEKVDGLAAVRIRLGMDACRLMLCCIFCEWHNAETLIDDLQEHDDAKDGFLMRSHFRRCYVGLAAFALSREEKDPKQQKKYLAIGKKMLKSFTKEMKYGSVNAFPIVAMLEAEQLPTKDRYDKAITATAKLGLVHHEAYMCERAAEMFRSEREMEWCNHYISEALVLYGEWGATGKVNRLQKDYGEVLQLSILTNDSGNKETAKSRHRYSAIELDSLRTGDWKRFGTSVNDDPDSRE